MSFLQLSLASQCLGGKTDVNILLPDCTEDMGAPEHGYQLLYLLHGYTGDYSDWIRYSLIENYTVGKPLVVVMPDGGKSFYTDMISGDHYWTYLSQELPKQLASYFRISNRRCDHFAMGLSMGAYGALKLGLTYPEQFQAIVGFSGVVDVAGFRIKQEKNPQLIPFCSVPPDFNAIYGNTGNIKGTKNDLYYLLEKIEQKTCPDLQLFCGTEDFLFEDNVRFFESAAQKGLPCRLETFAGEHNWEFWGKALKKAFEHLPFQTY